MILKQAILETDTLRKEFGGVVAIRDVSLEIAEGQLTALIGPNGAGKTTLFNLICGTFAPSAGRIFFRGEEINGQSPHQISALGIARTFQNVRLFGNMNVLENVMTGRHRWGRAGIIGCALRLSQASAEEREMRASAMQYLSLVGLEDRATDFCSALPWGQQKLVEIARALATEPALLLLDEPTGGLGASERDHLIKVIHRLWSEGMTIVVVEHDVKLVMSIAERVIVLDHGVKLAEGRPKQIQTDGRVISAYLGEG
jgi:branched-chain amino acid transport system ATP-binding protein